MGADSKPDIPQRVGSGDGRAVKIFQNKIQCDYDDDYEADLQRDRPPNKPKRQMSFASLASSIAGSTLSASRKKRLERSNHRASPIEKGSKAKVTGYPC